MTQITDEMCRSAIGAMKPDRIQGFSTPVAGSRRQEWGAPHYIRDVYLPPGQQEIWRGDSHDEMIERCAVEEMRLALTAALGVAVWQDISVSPPPDDGSRFDAWCQKPGGSTIGVRFADVSMRGDGSGFGFIDHTMEGPAWHYLGREDELYPLWEMTHWMPRPTPPVTRHDGGTS